MDCQKFFLRKASSCHNNLRHPQQPVSSPMPCAGQIKLHISPRAGNPAVYDCSGERPMRSRSVISSASITSLILSRHLLFRAGTKGAIEARTPAGRATGVIMGCKPGLNQPDSNDRPVKLSHLPASRMSGEQDASYPAFHISDRLPPRVDDGAPHLVLSKKHFDRRRGAGSSGTIRRFAGANPGA